MHAHTNALGTAGGIQLIDGATGPSECFGGGYPYVCVCICMIFVSLSPTLFLLNTLCSSDASVESVFVESISQLWC